MKVWAVKMWLVRRENGYWWQYFGMKFSQPGIRAHALYFLKRLMVTWYTKKSC